MSAPSSLLRRAAALVVALAALAGSGCRRSSELEAVDTPIELPAITLERLGGGNVSLAERRGKTVVLDFWATWCAPCVFQVPVLNRFYDAHRGDSDVELYGVSVDLDPEEGVARWVAEKEVRYPILVGGNDLLRSLGAVGIPLLVVIGPDGRVHSEHVGLIELEALEEALAEQRRARGSAPAPAG